MPAGTSQCQLVCPGELFWRFPSYGKISYSAIRTLTNCMFFRAFPGNLHKACSCLALFCINSSRLPLGLLGSVSVWLQSALITHLQNKQFEVERIVKKHRSLHNWFIILQISASLFWNNIRLCFGFSCWGQVGAILALEAVLEQSWGGPGKVLGNHGMPWAGYEGLRTPMCVTSLCRKSSHPFLDLQQHSIRKPSLEHAPH